MLCAGLQKVRPDVGHTAYGYNTLGEVIWSAPGASGGATACNDSAVVAAQKVSHSYDNLGELRTLSYPDSTQNKVHTLDNQGNLTRVTAGTVIWNYSYNSKHLPETESLSYDGRTFNLGWAYNNIGHVNSLTYPGGGVVAFNPNALGQARQAGSFASAASYYPDGQPSQFTFGNGIIRSYALDSQRRPQQLRDYYGSTNFINFSYGYDNNHNVTSISDSLASAYNLSLGYDASDRLDIANGQWGSGSFDYDALGNITQQKLGSSTLNYQYSNNRLTSVSGSQNRSFSYDSRGNITNNGLRSLSYNLANQLTASANLGYVYDGHNRLVKRTNSSGSSYHVYSQNGKLLHEVASNGSPTDYVYLGNQLVAKVKGATPSYVHNDLLGSPRLETNASRVIQSNSRQHYQPFGQRIPDSNYTDIGFTGHKHDGELGLTYMQQRYYDPIIGRFYSNDPVDFLGHMQRGNSPANGFNRYAYANNNPYKYVDPDGEFGIIGALIGGGIDAAIQIGNNMKNGQGFGDAVMNVDLGSVAVSAALGSVTGGATTLLKGAATGTTKVAGVTVQLTTKTERAVAGTLGANKAAAAGFVQAERKGKDGVQGAAAQVVNGVTSPVPVGTILMEGAAMLTGSDEQKTPPPEVDKERQ